MVRQKGAELREEQDGLEPVSAHWLVTWLSAFICLLTKVVRSDGQCVGSTADLFGLRGLLALGWALPMGSPKGDGGKVEREAEAVNLLTCGELQGAGCRGPHQTCSSWSVAPPQPPFQDSLGLAPRYSPGASPYSLLPWPLRFLTPSLHLCTLPAPLLNSLSVTV